VIQPLADVKPGSVTPFAQVGRGQSQDPARVGEARDTAVKSGWPEFEKAYKDKVQYAAGYRAATRATKTDQATSTGGSVPRVGANAPLVELRELTDASGRTARGIREQTLARSSRTPSRRPTRSPTSRSPVIRRSSATSCATLLFQVFSPLLLLEEDGG